MKTKEGSSITLYRCDAPDFEQEVVQRLAKLKLPVNAAHENGIWAFRYDGKCDGNTAHFLEMIIQGLIGLYRGGD